MSTQTRHEAHYIRLARTKHAGLDHNLRRRLDVLR